MEIEVTSTEETKKLASELAEQLVPGSVVALYGDLGSGKTTFTRFLVEALGIEARVQSPTFVIRRTYSKGEGAGERSETATTSSAKDASIGSQRIKHMIHLDLYRLTSTDELHDLDLSDVFETENAVTVIEWPELAQDFLPTNTIHVRFEYLDEESRKVTVKFGEKDA